MMRILVVEDSPTQAAELRIVLESEGYQVEVAGDGASGIERFRFAKLHYRFRKLVLELQCETQIVMERRIIRSLLQCRLELFSRR